MSEKKIYMVETVSTFRMRYAVEATSHNEAEDFVDQNVNSGNIKELSQHHLGEVVNWAEDLTLDEFIEQFDIDNEYLKSWSIAQKLSMVNSVE